MKKNLFFIMISTVLLYGCSGSSSSTEEDRFIEDILTQMTLEQKIGQMNQIHAYQPLDTIKAQIRKGEIGSILNIDPQWVNSIQKVAVEESPQGIPVIIGRDVIHGYKTIFPIPLGQACSFDRSIVEQGARVAAVEARSQGVSWTFAPMLDISRDPRWGRMAESLGEDPYLTGELGAAMVKGFQGEDLSDAGAIAACVKHFVGYGASEGGRDYNSTHIPPRLLRNVYLPPFEKAIRAGAATLMTSFNDNDGIPASGDDFLLKDILRKEWKFDGFVVSDWESMKEMIEHGFAADRKDVAQLSANAGVDMEMVSKTYLQHLPELVREKKVSEKEIDNAVRNILRIKYRLGLFTNPYRDTTQTALLYAKEHIDKAREAAVKSAVLLKNDAVLPLSKTTKIALIGPMADAGHDQLGTWSFDGDKKHTITPLKALQTEYSDVRFVYEPGLSFSRDLNVSRFAKVKEAVRRSDVAIVCMGEEAILSGEAHSLSDINLMGKQSELLQVVKSVGKPVVMVVMAGRPLTIERDLPYADAVLYQFHPGTMGGVALMDLVFGQENPSGRLPVTFPRHVGQIPLYYNHNNTGRPAPEKVTALNEIPLEAPQTSLGNTSFYLDYGQKPLYPFGFGLSYSRFEYSDLQLSDPIMTPTGSLTVSATIANTGQYDGTEVVQLYVRDLVGSISRPIRELKGFQRVAIQAGKKQRVEFVLSAQDLAFYGKDLIKKTDSGEFDIWIAPNSSDGLKGKFRIEK